ncbi:putative drug resistence protein [Leishmania major strain Friedlin]|uniref:Putative drug resistence protein n=1 Tax=Leishmania major TaxID=5664 RepID=Q4QHZ9_LEIMA|nr:putative drug resistence protein [Leishmania major strain Friedlin]CAG9569628.1 integral_membrane_transport_protein_-__putative [Leishmania major strain Friedlin]CAJ02413.1 putative drug resistence protein [Leishmania major strain Friedlin]|eukprot:XP_001681199.1 putative drug resistence protein [Leishmania major strain Friedlin]
MHPHEHHYGAAPLPAPEQEQPLGHYFSVTYAELLKAHVLDVHLPNILIGISASIEVPLVTILGRRIGASYSSIADYISVMALCRTLLDIPFGIAVEYVGVRNVMFLCLFLNIVASLVGLNVSNDVSLFAFCMLSGISLGGFFLARHIFVAGITSKKYRGLLMAILSGLLRWAHVIGPVASGIFASYSGDVRYSFVLSALASSIAFGTLAVATQSTRCQQVCERTCRASLASSVARTPLHSEQEEDAPDIVWHHPGGTGRDDAYVATALLPPATASFPTKSGVTSSLRDSANYRGIVGAERSDITSPPHAHHLHHAHANGGVATRPRSCSGASMASASLHPDTGACQEHNFHFTTLWYTFVDYWSVIWRLGLYIVLATVLRANRKLLISFAGMRAVMTDAQVSYLMGFSFIFDALLFPLGGLMMDLLGRQFAMVPTAVGLGIVFTFLPLCTTELKLYVAASAFGIVDALGCGIIMTLTADRAPPRCGAPFFGIMRTVQDMGHVVGARGVSSLMRYAGFDVCCWMLTVAGFFTAVWGVYGVPSDTETLLEAPRLEQAAVVAHERLLHKLSSYSQSSEETAPLTVVPATATPPTMTYGTATRPQPAPCVRRQDGGEGYRSVARS